jgi:hypothetical protein
MWAAVNDAASEQQREAEPFDEESAPRDGAASREDELFGDDAPTDPALSAAAARGNDALDIGGFYFLRGEYDALEQGAWQNFLFTSPNLIDLYFDVRPSERVRGYLRTRALYNPSIRSGQLNPVTLLPQPQTQLILDQLWLKFDVLERAYLTVGRQPVRFGSARFWNPTDFLNRQHIDPLAIFDERLGATLIKLNIPWEKKGWNFYAVANVTGVQTPADLGGLVRAELLLGLAEVALTAGRAPYAGPLQLGLDISAGLGIFDLHVESALQHGVQQTFYHGRGSLAQLQPYLRRDDWLLQSVAGAEVMLRYSDTDTVALGVEYFYNQLGYDNATQYDVALLDIFRQGGTPPFLYFGRHYLAAYVFLNKPGTWNNTAFTLSALSNLTDSTAVLRLDCKVRVLTYLDVNLYATHHLGPQGELHYAVNLPAGTQLTPQGLARAAPRSELGAGLRLYF